MEPLIDTIQSLAHQLSDKRNRENPNELALNSLDLFESQFGETLDAAKSKSDIVALVGKLISYLWPQADAQEEKDLLLECSEQKKVHFKCLFLISLLQPLQERRFFDIDLSPNLNYSTLLDTVLLHFDSFPKTALEVILLVCKFDCHILNYENIVDIFAKCVSLNSQNELTDIKNQILLTLCNLSAANRNFYRFNECFLLATNDIEHEDVLFDHQFERTYSEKSFELNWTSASKIWNLFVDNFQYAKYGQIRLFSLFLLHIKVIDNQMEQNRASLDKLMESTLMLIQDFTFKNERILSIYHSIGCLKLLLDSYDNSLGENASSVVASPLHDQSDLFALTNSSQWEVLYNDFESLLDEQKLFFVKLMIVKYKLIRIGQLDNEPHCKLLLEPISKIVHENCLVKFDILHFVLVESDYQSLSALTEHLFENLFSNVSLEVNSEIRRVLSSISVWENANFQSVFVTSFLKRLTLCVSNSKRKSEDQSPSRVFWQDLVSKEKLWVKYTSVMPDSKDHKHEKILALIKSACDTLGANPVQQIEAANVKSLLQLVTLFCDCVPLEHLSPLNQLRSILVLSSLLISLKTKSSDRTALANLFVRANLRIWDSVRSIWLFDLLSPSGYIYQMLYHLQATLDNSCYALFNCYVRNLFRMFDCAKSEKNVCELIELLNANESQVRVEYIFMVQTMILRNNAQFVKKLTNNSKFEQHKDSFEQIDKSISSLIYKNIKVYLEESETFDRLDSEFVVEGLTKLFEYKVISSLGHSDEPKLKNKWKKLLAKFVAISLENLSSATVKKSFVNFLQVIVQNRDKLNFALADNFVLDLWARLSQFEPDSSDLALRKKVSSHSHWKKVYQSSKMHSKFVEVLSENIARNKQDFCASVEAYSALLNTIRPMLTAVSESSSAEEFVQIISSCTEQLCQTNMARAVYVVQLLLQLVKANIDQPKCRALVNHSVPVLTGLVNLSFRCNKPPYQTDRSIQTHLHLATLQLARVWQSRLMAHDMLRNSHIYLVYNLCVESSLVHHTTSLTLFSSLFQQVNGILFDLIMRRSHLAIFSMCSQLSLLSTMLVALMRAAEEKKFESASEEEKIGVECCSKSFAQTLTQLANMDDFKPFALHFIAHYLHHSPDHSVAHPVKKNLTLGIFNLIDLIKDQEVIERFYSRLTQGSREVMKLLLEHHDKYHRFKGYV